MFLTQTMSRSSRLLVEDGILIADRAYLHRCFKIDRLLVLPLYQPLQKRDSAQ
ncbi:hypothetical protein [Chamaesiphon sp.]|uniref:hypothetical protein n=1 Tax=Chamaesiphon sp. TaxID=2814140 RepID=UPI0035942471